MNLDFNINLEQRQELVLTPQLKMAIEILQYSSLELKKFIEKEIQENPLLEEIDKFKADNKAYNQIKARDIEYEKFIPYQPGPYEILKEHLFEVLNKDEMKIGKFIIGSLNEKGELTLETELIADFFSTKLSKIENIFAKIKSLEVDFSKFDNNLNKTEYIEADIIIKKVNNEYQLNYKEKFSPMLKVNNYYYKLLKNSNDQECKAYLQEKYNSAIWLIKSILKRRETIKKIAAAILEKQKDFFEKGIEYLYVMTMEDIAAEIKMSESTVSRATTSKYMQTPYGIFSLKTFFNSGIGNISSFSIKAILLKEIAKEEKEKSLTDQKLTEIIKDKYGININRRTITKYRKSLGIANSRKRNSF